LTQLSHLSKNSLSLSFERDRARESQKGEEEKDQRQQRSSFVTTRDDDDDDDDDQLW
jgi:hypothetical protein